MIRRTVFVLAALAGTAHAEDAWETGVPAAQQEQANALFREGNDLYKHEQYQPALAKYTQAVALWQHPAIQGNLAATLIKLERYVEAADALDAALRFGAAPFSANQYDVMLNYQHLLAGQLGHVDVRCTQAGVTVLLDGKRWLQCPAAGHQRVRAGEHTVLAEKAGFITLTRELAVNGDSTASLAVNLVSLAGSTKLEYPVAPWVPWATSAAGLVVAGGGAYLWLRGRADMNDFRDDYVRYSASHGSAGDVCEGGCAAVPDGLDSDRRNAARESKIGVGALVVGGVMTAGGLTWAIINRPRRAPSFEVVPSAEGARATARWRF